MKILTRLFSKIAPMLLVSAMLGACARTEDGRIILKTATALPADHPSGLALQFFKERLEQRTHGRIEVRLFFNGQLGSSTECLESAIIGNIEISNISAAELSQFRPEFNVLSLPFLFRDKAHEYAVTDGPTGAELTAFLHPLNLECLGFFDAGSRSFMTKKGPVETPDDLRGMKIRVMSSRLMVDTIQALGASPVAMNQGEVYGALQTGLIDGWENNPPTALTFRMHETGCIYFARSRHLSIPDLLLINRSVRQRLPADLRAALDETARETVLEQRRLWQAMEQEAARQLAEEGMRFNDVDPEAFVAQTAPLYEAFFAKYGPEMKRLVEAVRRTH